MPIISARGVIAPATGKISHALAGWVERKGVGQQKISTPVTPRIQKKPKRIPLHVSRLQLLEAAGIQIKYEVLGRFLTVRNTLFEL